MKKPLKILAYVVGGVVALIAGVYVWATLVSSSARSRTVETHTIDFPVPFPLSAEEMAALGPDQDAAAVALEKAIERGQHLVSSRYACTECHGANYGGGTMIDDPMIGRALGPNITGGTGSRALGFTPSDWDRAVRHGVSREGRPTVMPAVDFQLMSNQELSDIIAYITSLPPVDNETAPVTLGPLGKVLVAVGALQFSADIIPSHDAAHPETPPVAEVSTDFGRHLAGVCTGCHGADLAGGPIPGGDPSWPPAKNLTPHEQALGRWTFEDFSKALLEGTRPDGTTLLPPMNGILPYAQNMTEVELQALWAYLRALPPVAPTP